MGGGQRGWGCVEPASWQFELVSSAECMLSIQPGCFQGALPPPLTWARAKKDMNSAATAMPSLASGAMMLPGLGGRGRHMCAFSCRRRSWRHRKPAADGASHPLPPADGASHLLPPVSGSCRLRACESRDSALSGERRTCHAKDHRQVQAIQSPGCPPAALKAGQVSHQSLASTGAPPPSSACPR